LITVRLPRLCALLLIYPIGHSVRAQTDPDIDRIPPVLVQPAGEGSSNRNLYLQGDLTFSGMRNDLAVPLPPPPPPQWEARAFLDLRLSHQLSGEFSLAYSGRLNLRAENGEAIPSGENIRHDLRETYLSWSGGNGVFLQLGRINLKSGVAEGFNPTDFFKTRAVVEPTSIDPAVLREDRLGVVMLQAQSIGPGGSVTMALAPKLAGDSPPYENNNLPSLNPMLDRTNARWRGLIKGSLDLSGGFSPEFLVYEEAGRSRFGLNLTQGLGKAVVAYAEWSGGRRASLAAEALQEGRATQVLAPDAAFGVSANRSFANDLAVGASYTTQAGINLDLEFDYHQAAFSAKDWRNWFGAQTGPGAPTSGEVWFIRGYAGDQQEPVARSAVFARTAWQNAFTNNLNLSGFAAADLRDSSGLAQFSADYNLSAQWTVGLLADVYFGARRSDFGSLPQKVSALLWMTRYLN
jgi:hypothetical protein